MDGPRDRAGDVEYAEKIGKNLGKDSASPEFQVACGGVPGAGPGADHWRAAHIGTGVHK